MLTQRWGICVLFCGGHGFRTVQCPGVVWVFPFAGCRTWRNSEKRRKDSDCKDDVTELNTSEDFQRTQAEMSGGYMGVCILFPLTTGVQILISGIKLLSSWEHPVQNSWRSCSQQYGTTLRTDPSMLASLSPNFFQTLSSQQTRNTTNSKVCLTWFMCSSCSGRKAFPIFVLSSCTPFHAVSCRPVTARVLFSCEAGFGNGFCRSWCLGSQGNKITGALKIFPWCFIWRSCATRIRGVPLLLFLNL